MLYTSNIWLDVLMKRLECAVEKAIDWLENNGMKTSSKCHLLVCGHKVGNTEVIEENMVKRLGIEIDSGLTFERYAIYL